jgi:putative ABC transport system ATP-binding protein
LNPTNSIIKTSKLSKHYQRNVLTQVRALRGISLEIMKGELVSIMGPSGSGKTTLLNILASFDYPTSGTVLVNGTNLNTLSEIEKNNFRRNSIGFISQSFRLVPMLTVTENVELPMLLAGNKEDFKQKKSTELLSQVGLTNRAEYKPNQLSGGEKQRVIIARSLANNPGILLCDEPTGNLDTETGQKIMDLFLSINNLTKKTIIIVTHDVEIARRTEKTFHIKDGLIDKIEPQKIGEL